jgi:hypothetical protein
VVAAVFRVLHDGHYDFIRIAEEDYEEWAGKILFEEADRGVSLTSLWNNDWEFVVMDEDEADHPGGLGDFVAMNGLIAATNERAHDILRSRFGDAAEVLRG